MKKFEPFDVSADEAAVFMARTVTESEANRSAFMAFVWTLGNDRDWGGGNPPTSGDMFTKKYREHLDHISNLLHCDPNDQPPQAEDLVDVFYRSLKEQDYSWLLWRFLSKLSTTVEFNAQR